MRSTGRPLKISFFGHFGSLNSGNESTLLAIISRLRSLSPECEFCCICTNPDAVVVRDGIEAVPFTTRVGSGIRNHEIRVARRLPMAFVALGGELRQYARAFRTLKGNDMLIVPGTGLLTDAYGLAGWGPYSLCKWVLMAKLRRCRVLFVSVGAGPIDGAFARVLVKVALSLADYRSYRDGASRDYLRGIGFRATGDQIYPDLVFSLPPALLSANQVGSNGTRLTVGLGLMLYPGKYSASDPRPETYRAYLETLAVFTAWLLERGYDIRLLFGDGEGDPTTIEEFRAMLRVRLGSYDEQRIIERPITSVRDLLAELAATDFVVATRFHNVLLALLLNKPAIAISFHHKCSSLMRQMKLSEYCHDINRMDTERLIEQFRKLEQNKKKVKRTIRHGVDQAREAVDEQYNLLFGGISAVSNGDMPRGAHVSKRLERAFLDRNESIWRRLPVRIQDLRPVRAYGAWLHTLACRHADREMYLGTYFLRNRPALELMRRLVQCKNRGVPVKIAVLGCSIGAEVYSVLWTLRSSRPDLKLAVHAVDISPEVVHVAERGVYSPRTSEMVNWPIFEGLTETERAEMFDWEGDEARVKPWLRYGVTWQVGDASDPNLVVKLGPQDLVIANNFLCHMPAASARSCLRNLAQLVSDDGYLFVTGVDPDVRTKAALELGWEPIPELRAEIHDGDPWVRSDWPTRWWGLEPLDRRRPDWETRYAAVFRIKADPQNRAHGRHDRRVAGTSFA